MTTPIATRIALSEIPDRFETLHVARTSPTGHRQGTGEAQPGGVFNHTTLLDNATNVALSQEYRVSPMPSPDEIVIRQRGRRRFTTWSPENVDIQSTRSPFQRTPTKMPLSTSMILRSSPRKRLTIGSTPPEPTLLPTESPIKISAKQQLWPGTPHVKKSRLDEQQPLAQLNAEASLATLLQGFSPQQLIEIIVNKLVAGNEEMEEKLRAELPIPNIEPLEVELLHAKRNIFKSLPTSRLCKKTDSAAYSRAAIHLLEFKRLLSTHTKLLHDGGHWDALLDYVTMAWPYVRATPHWDSVTHNTVRKQCFKLLACHCIASVKYGGLRLGSRLQALERNLHEWAKDYEDVLSCVNTLSKAVMKGRTSY